MLTPRTALRVALTGLALGLLPGCGTLYVLQAARGEEQLLHARRPIERVITDPRTPAALRATLNDVSAAREFASRSLGLPDNRSYRTYADIHRMYIVWNVVATPEFSVRPREWCFPVAGCVAYRGYFHEKSARRFAAGLAARHFDVLVDGVPAYSTLGRFADPLVSTMLVYGQAELAGIMFHELAHQLIYVRNDSAFNEAFATAVEDEGLARWLAANGRLAELGAYQAATARYLQYVRLLRDAREDLARLYASGVEREQMRARKRARLDALADAMRELEQRQHAPSPYRDWLESGLNNAHLASVATYYDCVPGFERMLREANGDLPAFYARVRELARRPQAERDALVCRDASSAPPSRDSG